MIVILLAIGKAHVLCLCLGFAVTKEHLTVDLRLSRIGKKSNQFFPFDATDYSILNLIG